jgi:hypothetical protein
MIVSRALVAVAALALMGGVGLAQDDVLVPGDPPLTQANVDRFRQNWEWYCDIRLTPEQDGRLRQAFVNLWRKRGKALNKQALANHRAREQERLALADRQGEEQERQRARTRAVWIASMRRAKDDVCLVLVPIYDAAYGPGGANNPILVAGDPPLTQAMVDLEIAVVELLLDLRLTGRQRHEYQQLLLETWKKADQDGRVKWAQAIATWDRLPVWSNYQRSVHRAFERPNNVERWRKDSSGSARWLVALLEASSKPGGARNPVLVGGDPPLTQLVVDRYGDYLEVMLGLALGGGFTAAQREVLQEYLVKGWKTMGGDGRNALLADLERWSEAAARGSAAANECIGALRPKLVASIYTDKDRPLYRWLLGVLERERQLVERKKKDQEYAAELRRIVEEMRQNIGPPPGHWAYNPATRRYDRWVPGWVPPR